MPQFMPISLRIGPFTTTIADGRARGRAARRHLRGRERENDREIFRPGARHHRVHRHLLDGVFPGDAEFGRLHAADDLVRLAAGARQHLGDALLGRQHDRQLVGPVVVEELALQIVFGVGLDQPRRGALERRVHVPTSLAVQRGGERLR